MFWAKISRIASENHMTIREVKEFIAEKFGLKVSYDTVHRWLRVKMKLPYGKPFTVDKRRPDNAEEMLADHLREELEGEEEVILVFMDESSFYSSPSTVRVFNPVKMPIERNREKIVVFGGLAVNGESTVIVRRASNRWSFIDFLRALRRANPVGTILLILDNAPYHWAAEARLTARKLGIKLCYLPPYSPDLNPIEYLWRDLKRTFAFQPFETIKNHVEEAFLELANNRKYTYSKAWLEKFSHILDEHITLKQTARQPNIFK